MTTEEAQTFIGQYVDITWDEPTIQEDLGIELGYMEGVVEAVWPDGTLVLDWGVGIKVEDIKTMKQMKPGTY